MRWTLGAAKRCGSFFTSDPGNVDLLKTMPLPDSAANAGTPMPKIIGAHEGAEFESK